jgi:hypothetical protein
VTGGLRGSLTLARVRIHDGVLDDAGVLNNYNQERAAFVDPVPAPQVLTTLPIHRYSFSEPATTSVAPGTPFLDSIGTAHGTVENTNAQFNGSRLVLPGGTQEVAPYGDLPNGLLSTNSVNNGGTGEVSIEGWVRVTGSRAWARIFDFGSRGPAGGTGVEVLPSEGNPAGEGRDYLFLSAQVGGDTAVRRIELRNEDPAGGGLVNADAARPGVVGVDTHFVVTWKETTGELRYYHNGLPVSLQVTDDAISDIRDLNVWLGRSAYAGDQSLQGEFDEFRIYNYVLSPGQIFGNFQSGANVLNTGGQPVAVDLPPANLTIEESYRARFSVLASGSPPIGYQWLSNGVVIADATNSTFSLPNVSLADSGARFSVIVSNFAAGTSHVLTSPEATLTVVSPTVTLKHQYTFNQPAGATVVIDSAGDKNGVPVGGATFNGSRLLLNGTDGYVNLPNNLVTGFTSITIEAWVQDDGSGGWARIFDFGNSAAGEDFPLGSAGNGGTQYMFLSLPAGPGNLRGAYTILGGGAAEQIVEWPGNRPPAGALHHIVWTSSDSADTGRLYVNGTKVGENENVFLTPAALGPTVNNWLGRAQFNDPLFLGQFDEISIWDGAMSAAQIAARFAQGPDTTPAGVRLSITRDGANVIVSYPAFAEGFFLEYTEELLGPTTVWQSVSETGSVVGDQIQVTIPITAGARFFRLSQ